MTETAPAVVPSTPQWIVSRKFDLAWFFSGAAVSLGVLALFFGARVPIVPLFWIWLLGFDGPHIGAAFTRTYFDREEWKTRPKMLLLSLLTFAIGPVFLALNLATGSQDPFLLYLGLATFYGYYHVVRQHYGFLALYKARNRDFDKTDLRIDRWALYAGCWAPYFYFLLTHPKARVLLHLSPGGPETWWEKGAVVLTLAVWGIALLAFAVRQVTRPRGAPRLPQTCYLLVTTLLYSMVYFLVARYEPVYAASNGPDQDFLLLSVVVVIFHNIQYLGLVWFHNRNRYAARSEFGPAGAINRSVASYLIFCIVFSGLVYLSFAASTGVFPWIHLGLQTRWGPITFNQIGLCLWWGLALNHYYLDQKIWRIRGDHQLKKNLGLA
jgi:hypothetical protein